MSAATLARLPRGAIELRVEDRLQSLAAPIRDMSAAMICVLAGSIIVHGLLLATAVVAARQAAPAAPKEIAVEVVQEAPKPPPAPQVPAKAPPPSRAMAQPAPKAAIATPRPAPKPVPPKPPAAPSAAQEAKALQNEIARLRAEQAALKAARGEQQAGFDRALALPSIGGGDGDAVTYDQLVFSQLAKAKGEQADLGQAGVTCVRFEMDAHGGLVSVEIVTPSGNPKLDAKAVDIVRRAAPFPPPPTEADRTVFANVNFTPTTATR